MKVSDQTIRKRYKRLFTLKHMLEGLHVRHTISIYQKCIEVLNKYPFTGILRLNSDEKEFLSHLLEQDNLTDDQIDVIRFYCGIK